MSGARVDPILQRLTQQFQEEGAERYANWDGAAFEALCQKAGNRLAMMLRNAEDKEQVLTAYFKLGQEALAAGYLRRSAIETHGSSCSNLIELAWLRLIPMFLPTTDLKLRLQVMLDLWNLGEGLLSQPAWLNQVIAARLSRERTLDQMPALVGQCLQELWSVPIDAKFEGPYTVRELKTRDVEPEFLPGEMHWAAPAVLCIHDRIRPDLHAGIMLQTSGEHRFLGLVSCLGEGYREERPKPTTFGDGWVRFGASQTPLPGLRAHHRSAMSAGGFFVASAIDSQRLWVVVSP